MTTRPRLSLLVCVLVHLSFLPDARAVWVMTPPTARYA